MNFNSIYKERKYNLHKSLKLPFSALQEGRGHVLPVMFKYQKECLVNSYFLESNCEMNIPYVNRTPLD